MNPAPGGQIGFPYPHYTHPISSSTPYTYPQPTMLRLPGVYHHFLLLKKRLSLGGGVYLSEYDISKSVMYYSTLTSIRESSYSYVLCKKKLENIHNLLTKGKQIMKW